MKDKLSIGLSLDRFHSLANSATISGNFSSQISPCSLYMLIILFYPYYRLYMNIHFEKANLTHKELIFNWLEEPHIKEFWDK